MGAQSEWSEKFPDMKPISSPPGMMTINGIGTSVYGGRDHDPDTGTYIKTLCFCFLFVPIIALGAYRVADARQGWYFLGKVPLSRFAKFWNLGLLASIVGLVGWSFYHSHASDPANIAGKKLSEANSLAEAGQVGKAAPLYGEVMAGRTLHSVAAREKVKHYIENPPGSLEDAAAIYLVAVESQRQGNAAIVPDLFAKGSALVNQHAPVDAKGALALLEAIAPLAPQPDAVLAQRRDLLEILVKQQPDDPELASRLAVLYESQNEGARCEALLAPHAQRLGSMEGARILGHIYATQGKHEQGYALLQPYIDARLPKMHAAEQAFRDALKQAQQQALNDLKSGKAAGFDYGRHRNANQAAQDTMVNDFIDRRLRDNPAMKKAQQDMTREAPVVGASLDLGIVRLHRAQSMADPAARRAELESAEKTFLAIRSMAGQDDAYRMYLGQVYYWLDKSDEGRKLFDELLAAQKRAPVILAMVGGALREVGAVGEARTLVEEAYNKETDQPKKKSFAGLRAVMRTDIDDEITWLERANAGDPDVKAQLHNAKGHKAFQAGREDDAAGQYRQAIDVYSRMPENPTSLNNGALAHLSLYRVTLDRADFNKAIEKIDKALALNPSDTILLGNAASAIWEAAMTDVVGNAVDLKALKRRGGSELLPFLYNDSAGKKQYADKVRAHPGIAKARSYFEKLVVLAPKRASSYSFLVALHETTREFDALKALAQRLDKADLDQTDADRDTRDHWAGKEDAKHRTDLKTGLARQEGILQAVRKQGGRNRAVAAATLAAGKMGATLYMPEINPDEYVKLAEEAHAAARSAATHQTLTAALCQRAHQTLAKEDPSYQALATRVERSLGSTEVLAFVLAREGTLRDKALANADVKRTLALIVEHGKRFPEDQGPWTWAMLRAAYPDEAARIAAAQQKDEFSELERAINRKLSPLSASAALSAYWTKLLAGKDEAEARTAVKPFSIRGVPLPLEVK
ncbi:hypothetical protein AYO44_07125 [Planctomycetaceae bacterium SCGC AG-212-F19]|nr:hypothetical protein AYO44_07125 [Planctomycetaceae bacterium SCGC AG-212-F19]